MPHVQRNRFHVNNSLMLPPPPSRTVKSRAASAGNEVRTHDEKKMHVMNLFCEKFSVFSKQKSSFLSSPSPFSFRLYSVVAVHRTLLHSIRLAHHCHHHPLLQLFPPSHRPIKIKPVVVALTRLVLLRLPNHRSRRCKWTLIHSVHHRLPLLPIRLQMLLRHLVIRHIISAVQLLPTCHIHHSILSLPRLRQHPHQHHQQRQ